MLQHDTIVSPSRCGGPLLGSRGEVLGVNIARSGRTQTLAIPADTVNELVTNLLAKRANQKN